MKRIVEGRLNLEITAHGMCVVCGRREVKNSKTYYTDSEFITDDYREGEIFFKDMGWMEVTIGNGCYKSLILKEITAKHAADA